MNRIRVLNTNSLFLLFLLISNWIHIIHLYHFILVTLAQDIMPWLIAPRSNGLWSILLLQRAPSTKLLSFSFYVCPSSNTTLLFQIQNYHESPTLPVMIMNEADPGTTPHLTWNPFLFKTEAFEYTTIITSHVTQHTHHWSWHRTWNYLSLFGR